MGFETKALMEPIQEKSISVILETMEFLMTQEASLSIMGQSTLKALKETQV